MIHTMQPSILDVAVVLSLRRGMGALLWTTKDGRRMRYLRPPSPVFRHMRNSQSEMK